MQACGAQRMLCITVPRFLGSILAPANETVSCLFDGQEADVRAVSEKAGVPFERVLESLRIDGNDLQEEGL